MHDGHASARPWEQQDESWIWVRFLCNHVSTRYISTRTQALHLLAGRGVPTHDAGIKRGRGTCDISLAATPSLASSRFTCYQ